MDGAGMRLDPQCGMKTTGVHKRSV
ncbi:hypothetical protein CBM2605_A250010 [Cupriavidus neocaledonicus]|uniref:Cobalamin-independent methionine synthase MetE C-terminal/archaeal domain-containing protein n=1 Tax=Cupriavidus neocaledonicus TaxID=1040979 RepID=A0ABY1V0F4_9BURK|nr:hypothetical protein CBM2605_A250010 [Cupriavidus neocaledonicus]